MVMGAAVTMGVTVVVGAGFAVLMLMLGGFSSVVMRATFAVFMLVLVFGSFSAMVVCATFAVLMLVLVLGGFSSVVVCATFAVLMLVFGCFSSVVMRATFAMYMLVLVLGSVVMRTALTMNMLVGRFLRICRRIRQSGNKA